jgi:acyl-CoA thioester hydrolase
VVNVSDASRRPAPPVRADFHRFVPITTRWHDNDVFGHVNNVIYYSYFDTAVNRLLIDAGVLDLAGAGPVFLVAETACTFFSSVAFPDALAVGVSVARLGRSSVTYRLGLFRDGGDTAVAEGRFVHVLVDRATHRPMPIEGAVRAHLVGLIQVHSGAATSS